MLAIYVPVAVRVPGTRARDPEPDTLRLWHFCASICQRTGIECGLKIEMGQVEEFGGDR